MCVGGIFLCAQEVEGERQGWEAERGSLQQDLTILRAELGQVKRAKEVRSPSHYCMSVWQGALNVYH